jgi:hypothetical protein
MKALLTVWLMFVLPIANAIQVSGEGRTFEEAKHNGFRTAIEITVGAVVASERITRNDILSVNEILVYSAGFIDNYKINSKEVSPNGVFLLMDVSVSENKLKDFLLSKPKNVVEFETERHIAQLSSYQYEKSTGDQLIDSLFKQYPYNAFNIKQEPYQFKHNPMRGAVIVIPYEITWNYKFLSALNDVLYRVEDVSPGLFKKATSSIAIESKNPDNLILGKTDVHYFNDMLRMQKIKENLSGLNDPRLQVTMTNMHNKKVLNMCVYPNFLTGYQRPFYRLGRPNHISIFGNEKERHSVKIELGKDTSIDLSNIRYITVAMVANKDCDIIKRR